MEKPYISIVVPAYNEEGNLTPLMDRLLPVMRALGKPFEIIFTDDATKEEVYRQSGNACFRGTILEGCSSTEILKIGMKDSDGYCRFTAFSKIPRWLYSLDPAGSEAILSSDDKDALLGLARNDSLSVEMLEKVTARLEALGDH